MLFIPLCFWNSEEISWITKNLMKIGKQLIRINKSEGVEQEKLINGI